MAEMNPFAPPDAAVEAAAPRTPDPASRASRLLAVLNDVGMFGILPFAAVVAAGVAGYVLRAPNETLTFSSDPRVPWFFVPIAVLLALNAWTLATRGATLGKLMAGIRIARRSGERAGFFRIVGLRILPLWIAFAVLSEVDLVLGAALLLGDVLLVFRADRRCLHDLIAGTVVVSRRV
ncbi:MAG: RDD family protein [Planctomycetes bacterium]|nr:RDD family protein [Planctomycetota bacterium]